IPLRFRCDPAAISRDSSSGLNRRPSPEHALVAGLPVGVRGFHDQAGVHDKEEGRLVVESDLDAGKLGVGPHLDELHGLTPGFTETETMPGPVLSPGLLLGGGGAVLGFFRLAADCQLLIACLALFTAILPPAGRSG